jgi:threonine dehydrogenase-like Zn-dependent dehydrogenase
VQNYETIIFYQPVLRLFENGKIDIKGLVSHTFTLDHIDEAFKTAEDPEAGKMKIIVS